MIADQLIEQVAVVAKSLNHTADTENWCAIHQTEWFRKGKMRRFAHPIDGTNPVKWCNRSAPKKIEPKAEEMLASEIAAE